MGLLRERMMHDLELAGYASPRIFAHSAMRSAARGSMQRHSRVRTARTRT
jgi:hypothetical protein